MDWVDKPQNYKDLYGTLQLLRGSHLDNFPRKTLKLGWVAPGSFSFSNEMFRFARPSSLTFLQVLSRLATITNFKMAA